MPTVPTEPQVVNHGGAQLADESGVLHPLPEFKGSSEALKTAKRLHAAAVDAAKNKQRVRDVQTEQVAQYHAAVDRFHDLQRRATFETIDQTELTDALAAIRDAEAICGGHQNQGSAAENARKGAVRAYGEHLRAHYKDLMEARRETSESVSERLLAWRESGREIEAEYQQVAAENAHLAAYVNTALRVPTDGSVPIPELPDDAAPDYVEIGGQKIPVISG
jgi:hypothetical protein